jgi:hypothetical protein
LGTTFERFLLTHVEIIAGYLFEFAKEYVSNFTNNLDSGLIVNGKKMRKNKNLL